MDQEISGKPNTSMAIMKCHLRGLGICFKEFNELLREYNDYQMPLSERVKLIAEEKDEAFFEFVKYKIDKN